ncbi:Cro/Cl family transcriptional regulator [Pseudomonas viridiflava]|uniref:Cro/Cl family transcriptional regulator n=1 Tax=Pseudomonas viridiflava TaxID=33069 RepID=UPI000F051E89|nr:Cro/Cl family transcriptional regulator [Pseudomonas viridiflava]
MSLKNEIAATLRAVRQQKQVSYENLGGGSMRTTIGYLERAEAGVTLDKLADIARALDFNLVALIALCVAHQKSLQAETVLEEATLELQRFLAAGGAELIQSQFEGGKLIQRVAGKPLKSQNRDAVLRLKGQGKTPAEAVKILGLPRTTVNRYWQHATSGE